MRTGALTRPRAVPDPVPPCLPLLVLLDGASHGRRGDGRVPVVARCDLSGSGPDAEAGQQGDGHADRMLDVVDLLARAEPRPVALGAGVVLGPDGVGDAAGLARGLHWAADVAADVVAVPLGLAVDDPAVRRAVTRLLHGGTVLVAAAGNPYAGQSGALYPAAYPGVVAAGAREHAASYAGWLDPPDAVVDLPAGAGGLGTSAACVVVAWRRLADVPSAAHQQHDRDDDAVQHHEGAQQGGRDAARDPRAEVAPDQ